MSALEPVYKKLRDDLRSQIESGGLLPGEMLPSENELAQQYGISRGSTRLGLSELEAEKLIERKTGKGTVVRHPAAITSSKPKIIGIDVAGHPGVGDFGYYHEFVHGVSEACTEFNCRIQFVGNDDLKGAEVADLDALVIMRYEPHLKETIAAIAEGIPVVVVNRFIQEGKVGHVRLDDVMEAFRATEHLIKLGHGRIAFVGGLNPDGALRQKGYAAALRTYGLPTAPELVIARNPGDDIFAAVRGMMTQEAPTAVFSASGAYHMTFVDPIMRELHLRIPEEVSLVCFDDIESNCFHYGPALTCVRQPLEEMGRAAVKRIAEYDGKPIRAQFHAELVLRQSCRDLKRPKIADGGTVDA